MQQISDHVRQEFIAMSALYAQPAQGAPSAAFTCVRQPKGVTPPGCHYQSSHGFGHSPIPWTNPHEQPVYALDTRLEPQPFSQAQMLSGRPPSMQSQSILGQQHTSPQQLFSNTHSRPALQHQAFVPAGQPACQHLQAQPTDTSLAPQAAAACRQSSSQAAAANSPAYGVAPWQHHGLTMPHSSSPLLHHALLPAAAASTALACCPSQPHCTVPPQHAAALGVPLHQGDVLQSASISQLSELVRCPSQSMPFSHDPSPHVPLTPAALRTGPLGAAARIADSMAGKMNCQSVSAAMPAVQQSPADSSQPSLLQPARAAGQPQQQSVLPLTSGRPPQNSLPASQQLAAPGKPGHAPLHESQTTGTAPPSRAAGLSSLLGTREQGQPAILPLATEATCEASAPIPPAHAAGSISIPHPATAGHTAALPTHHSDTRPASLSAPAYPALPADVVKASTMPQRIAWPGETLAAAPIPVQDLPSPSSMPGQATALDTSPQLRQTTHACASTKDLPAAASLPVSVGQAMEQVASDASFRFQPQVDCVQVSAGVCCTPVLRPRGQGIACVGTSVTMNCMSIILFHGVCWYVSCNELYVNYQVSLDETH